MNKINFINTLANLRPSATFLRLHGYSNELGEVANYSLVFHISYPSALERSISILENYQAQNELEVQAKDELISSFKKSLNTNKISESYSPCLDQEGNVIKGIKLHNKTNTLYLYGAVINKDVIKPCNRKQVNKRILTLVKDKLRALTPVNAFCQFKITSDRVQHISVEKLQIKPSF